MNTRHGNKQPSATKSGPGRYHEQSYRKAKPARGARSMAPGQRALERHRIKHNHVLTEFVTSKNLARRAQIRASIPA